jgi:prepilin-type N-terminal cleavage/methylation domain-containing protein
MCWEAQRKAIEMKTERQSRGGRKHSGFSLLEMILATAVLLMGLVGVAQLVPASLLLNQQNRSNSSALVMAQRQLEVLAVQPLSSVGFFNPETGGIFCELGDPTQPGQVVGSPLALVNNLPVIDFSQATVPGYSMTYLDPNDPAQTPWDVRWAVITNVAANPSIIMNKRIILGAHATAGVGIVLPVTLDRTVSK